MNPKYLWLTEVLQFLAFFVIGPAISLRIAYETWRKKTDHSSFERHWMLFVTFGVIALLLFEFAKWIDADARTGKYFLQLACVLLSGLVFGVSCGYGWSVSLKAWRWHKSTRLK